MRGGGRHDRTDPGDRLACLVDRAARELPPHPAPATLADRVMREIEHRSPDAARRRGFHRWPLAIRAALIAGCCACAALVPLALSFLWGRIASSPHVVHSLDAMRQAEDAGAALASLGLRAVRAIPSDWLLGGLLAAALLYTLLFALLALGYSMLYAVTERSGSHPT